MSSGERVTRSTLGGQAFPILSPRPLPAVPERVWSQEEWERICLGWQARDMDEKWDIFAEDSKLFMHQSWTGYCIYEASFIGADGGVRITEGVVESDQSRYRSPSEEFDCVMVELLIRSILLGETATELRRKLWPRSR